MKHFITTAVLLTLILLGAMGQIPSTRAQSKSAAPSEVTSTLYLPLLTGGNSGNAPVALPAELVTTWYSGNAPLNDFYNPQTGEWSEVNGVGQMVVFATSAYI